MSDQSARGAGHRLVPHVADVILEAWGTTRVACLEEAALGLVESFADIEDIEPTDRIPVSLRAVSDEDVLVLLLEEVIYVIEALGKVPLGVDLAEHADGSVGGFFATIPSERVEAIGALPKGVSRSDLLFERRNGQWRCHVLVDV
ncbi:MAG: archease [Acidimicrobiia bacterium]